jgi:mRNA interferase RelE/StbE
MRSVKSDYRLIVKRPSLKFLSSRDKRTKARLSLAIDGLLQIPPKGDIKPLVGSENKKRLRVGSFRIIFVVDHDEETICILNIDNRGDVYK